MRVRNKIIRETRKEALQLKNDDIDLEDIQGELETRAKFISTPLDRMVKNQEISSYETTVLEGHEDTFLEDETMRVRSATCPGAISARWRSTWGVRRLASNGRRWSQPCL